MSNLYIGTDNVVMWSGMTDAETGSYENAATVKMSLFKNPALNINNAAAATQELQTLLPDTHATAGTWTLTYDGLTTAAIQWNATTAQVQAALELLANIAAGDVTVEGDTLDTNPVVGGMTFLWKNTLGDVNLLSFDFTALTGPTQAGSTMTETTKGILQGVAVNEGGGNVGIPVIGHTLIANDYIRIEGSTNYNDEYSIVSVTNDKIVITAAYVAETFLGTERVYEGVTNGTNITLPYVAASNGNYRGILPDTLLRLVEYAYSQTTSGLSETGKYWLFVWAEKGASKTTKRIALQAGYSST